MSITDFDRRVMLHKKLEAVMSDYGYIPHVYWQMPSNTKMQYPAIRYSMDDASTINADDINYSIHKRYTVIIIDKNPDSYLWRKVLSDFQMSNFDRHYATNELHHWVINLYF